MTGTIVPMEWLLVNTHYPVRITSTLESLKVTKEIQNLNAAKVPSPSSHGRNASSSRAVGSSQLLVYYDVVVDCGAVGGSIFTRGGRDRVKNKRTWSKCASQTTADLTLSQFVGRRSCVCVVCMVLLLFSCAVRNRELFFENIIYFRRLSYGFNVRRCGESAGRAEPRRRNTRIRRPENLAPSQGRGTLPD